MKIEVGQIWRARNGDRRRVVCVDAPGSFPIITVDACGPHPAVETHTVDGRVNDNKTGPECGLDLIAEHREPMKRTGWLIQLADGDEYMALDEDDVTLQYARKECGTIHRGTWTKETP